MSGKTTDSPDPVDVFVGAKLRERRLILGLSQDALAATGGVAFQQVQKYERGANRISASRLYQFARALDVEPGFFFPKNDAELEAATPDPTALRARYIYEQARRRVTGRPRWEDLNPNDAYDKAMIDLAMRTARAELKAEAA